MSISIQAGRGGFGAVSRRCVPLLVVCSVFGCRSRGADEDREAQVVTEVASLRPAVAVSGTDEGGTEVAPEGAARPVAISVERAAATALTSAVPHRAPSAAAPSASPPVHVTAAPNARDLSPGAVASRAEDTLEADASDDRSTFCRAVEAQARDTNAALPQRLDDETSATRVVAYGCDVIMEYAMLDLSVDEIANGGVGALFDDVVQKICTDRGARGVLDRGGSFTNVYRDRDRHLIDQFTIGAVECARAANAPPDAARRSP